MLRLLLCLMLLASSALAQGGPDGVSTSNPIWIPPQQSGQFGTFTPMVPQIRSGNQTITHPFNGLTIVSSDATGVTYNLSTPATSGDSVCFIQGGAGAITFTGANYLVGTPTTTAGQYARQCAYYLGTTWVLVAPTASSTSYVGPGDLVSGASAWYGLRGYNAAYASPGTNNAINIRRASDNTTKNIVILNTGALDVATAGTFCTSTTCFIATWYDQSGNGINATQATTGNQPQLIFSCFGSLPCVRFNGSTQTLGTGATPYYPNLSQPYTMTITVERTGAFTSQGDWFASAFPVIAIGSASTANNAFMAAQSNVNETQSDSALHHDAAVFNGASSVLYVDDVSNTTSPGTSGIGTNNFFNIGSYDGSSDYFTGEICEIGVWPSGFTSANATSMCHNQYTYWGGALSC